ncbi:hypothetical protein niasHS_014688 [Heterodera schachtii]|uniref:Uncharacterized protein n=1 Tax=Heterodera schachtii TaxID=97005 RepID=A0ABD2II13_HETSC
MVSPDFECRVCHAYATGLHFGAQSCQACCAFFRRSVVLKRNYLCQKLSKIGANCPIVYTEKVLCRSCRMVKCLTIGMNKNAVQLPEKRGGDHAKKGRAYFTKSGLLRNKRFANNAFGLCSDGLPTAPRRSADSPLSSASSAHSADCPSSSSASSSSASLTIHPSSSFDHSFSTSSLPRPSPIASFRPVVVPNWDILGLFIEEEMRIGERRRILFCERPVASLLGRNKSCPFSREDIRPLSFQEFRRSIRTHILLVYEWLRVWPGFARLAIADQITLLRKCVLYHTILDPCFLTTQMGDLDKFVLPNGGYVSTKRDEGWEDEPEISRDTKMSIYWPLLVPLMCNIVSPMLLMRLDFDEFVALKAFVSFQMTLPDVSSAGRALISSELSSLCQSLHKYYETKSETFKNGLGHAERFGNLLLLLSPIFETANIFVESHHIIQFFDLWEMDSLMLQFLKNKS